MKKSIISILSLFLLIGCSQKIEHSIQLEDVPNRNINLPLINKIYSQVPKDKLMMSQSWHYKQTTYRGEYLFSNEEIAATFYLAHHATHIYIWGNEHNFKKYRNYFLENQVTAVIKFIPKKIKPSNKTIIDYFRINKIKESIKLEKDSMGKTNIKPSCEVIEIPNNFIKDFK